MTTWHFAAALAATLLAGSEIQLFMAEGPQGICALLPLCRNEGWFARWRMLGAEEVFEPNDALCQDAAAAALLAASLASQPRPVELDRLPAGSRLLPALRAAMRGRGWVRVRQAIGSPVLPLDARWTEPESCFKSGRRSDMRRAARRAAEFGTVTYDMLSPGADEFDALFDEAVAVEGRSWKREAGTAMAVDPAKQAFFRAYFRAACAEGTFRLAVMRIDGKAVAMQMAVVQANRYWLFKIGHDEAFSRCSPGTLLMLFAVGEAARRGHEAVEMLGNVEPWITELWTRDMRECLLVRTYPFNLRGAAAFLRDGGKWLVRRLFPVRA